MMRQRRHDLRLDVSRRAHPTRPVHLVGDLPPEFPIPRRITLSNGGFRKLTIEPGVQRRRENTILVLAERHFTLHHRPHFLIALATLARRTFLAPVASVCGGSPVQ